MALLISWSATLKNTSEDLRSGQLQCIRVNADRRSQTLRATTPSTAIEPTTMATHRAKELPVVWKVPLATPWPLESLVALLLDSDSGASADAATEMIESSWATELDPSSLLESEEDSDAS